MTEGGGKTVCTCQEPEWQALETRSSLEVTFCGECGGLEP
jgi:hypothetical protein